ncbi:PREDICTED: olfactory receptor 5L1-like [Colobus angolensis palliatus]|uniref:olfactory receptor 5L1-like n=1 Tax=Colobus angolensis palliatus TaxID=336983 RepID=UPI0005F3B97B|nr:PREDICTED: olfactory receptor 5L1-like [Colobus angolensis palliatus]
MAIRLPYYSDSRGEGAAQKKEIKRKIYFPVITVVTVGPRRELMITGDLLPFITHLSNQQFNFLVPERPSVDFRIQECNFLQPEDLKDLTDDPQFHPTFSALFLPICVVMVMGNLGLLAFIVVSPQFLIPIYFFLSNQSSVDFCYSSVTVPKISMGYTVAISMLNAMVQSLRNKDVKKTFGTSS